MQGKVGGATKVVDPTLIQSQEFFARKKYLKTTPELCPFSHAPLPLISHHRANNGLHYLTTLF